jgi:anti-anti-sigma factor
MNLDLQYEIKDRIIIISFFNELNFVNHAELTELLERDKDHYDAYIFDLTNITYIDSSALNSIYRFAKIKKVGMIKSAHYLVEAVFKIAHFEKIFKIFDTVEDALIHFSGKV